MESGQGKGKKTCPAWLEKKTIPASLHGNASKVFYLACCSSHGRPTSITYSLHLPMLLSLCKHTLRCSPCTERRLVCFLCTSQNGEAEIGSVASPLLRLTAVRWGGVCPRVHHHQPVQDGDLAGGDPRRELRRRRVRAPSWTVDGVQGARGVVGPHLGPHRLHLRRLRQRLLRHRLLRLVAPLRRLGRAAGEPRRVHPRRRGLLRRQPRGRLQPAHRHQAGQRAGQLQHGGVQRRPPADVPVGAGRQGQRPHGGLPERLRRLRHGPVLLPRPVREPLHVPAHLLLQEVQGRLPDGLQLRLRRPHQHLHLLQRRLHHHLLLQHQAVRLRIPQQSTRLQQRRLVGFFYRRLHACASMHAALFLLMMVRVVCSSTTILCSAAGCCARLTDASVLLFSAGSAWGSN